MISAYEGEEIIEKIVISGGVKNYHRKYIPRSVFHGKPNPAEIKFDKLITENYR